MIAAKAAGRTTLLVMGFVLLSRVLGVVRDILIGQLFGQNITTDIYTAAFRIPDILQYLVAGGALATVFVPVFTQYWSEGKEKDAWRIFGAVMTLVAIVASLLVIVMELAAGPIARAMNPALGLPSTAAPSHVSFTESVRGFFQGLFSPTLGSAEQQRAWEQVARLSRILLPAQWCFFVGGLMMGTLHARQRFLVPALGPILYNGGIIVAGVLLHKTLGIAALCWGALFGALCGNFLLPLWELRRTGAAFWIGFDTRHPGVRKVGALMLPALLGLSLSQLGFWITGSYASGEGHLSALRNAYNLTQAPIGIFAQASAIVLFPTIARLAADNDMYAFRRELHYGVRRILFLTVPASLLMATLAQPIIAAIYLKGKFTPADVPVAAAALWCYSVGTFAWSAQAVLARGFYALQDSKTPTLITTAMVALFVALCSTLPGIGALGYRGLALALSLAGTLNMLIFLFLLQRRTGGLDLRGLAIATVRITLAALIGGAVALLYLHLFWPGPTTRLNGIFTTVVAGTAALAAYGGACLLLKVPELRTIRTMLRKAPSP
jgi:putative peptidoglycan lipid II flippase